MKRLFLLDAYALIYRAYYAFMRAPRVNSKGLNTSAIFGFVNTLEDLLKREDPTHLAVVFDPAGETFRHKAYEPYKAQRQSTPEDIKVAVPIIKQIIEAYNIPIIEVPEFEADDVIGTLSCLAEKAGFEVFMMTPDKDYGQLVTEKVKIYKPRHGAYGFDIIGVDEVLSKWELSSTAQVIDMLGLMGDTSDNIPGCPGVGEKGAMKLLKEFGSIEGIIANTEKLKGAMKRKIEENVEITMMSKFLATIRCDVPIEFDPIAMERREINRYDLLDIFTELEFRNLISRIIPQSDTEEQVARRLRSKQSNDGQTLMFDDDKSEPILLPSQFASVDSVEHNYHTVDTVEGCMELAEKLSQYQSVCFDTETTSLNTLEAELVGISFAVEPHRAYYIPISEERGAAMQFIDIFKPLLEDASIEKCGHNIKYDFLVLRNYDVVVQGKLFDTMIAHYLLQPELRHGMDYLAEIFLNYTTIHIDELIGKKGKKQLSMREVPLEIISEYAAEDADVTLQLKQLLNKQLIDNNLLSLFEDVEMPLVRVLVEMERVGVLIDDFALGQSAEVLSAKLSAIERKINQLSGTKINISSPKQVGELLFDILKLSDKPRKTKKGQYVTDEETLESLRSKHEVIGEILEYRGVKKLLSTYVEALPKLINANTGRVHTSFNQSVTATGRLSSSNPNLQNIPIRDDQGREIRRSFVASEGCKFLSADYSQVELRIMAHLSGDENMVAAFLADYDIHTATAANIYKVPLDEVTSDMRRKAKTANFGIIYGISVFGLSERLGVSRFEAKELIDGYFESFPGVKRYMDYSIEQARERGYVETFLGRRRYLADINSANATVRGYAERNAINAPIQGAAADIIKIAMVRVANRIAAEGLRAEMVLQVHDELNFNVPVGEVEKLTDMVREEMQNAIKLNVPLKVDIGVGDNWLEAH
ncbi:MAG: DNA polymerase I [bacterium]